MLHNYTRTHTKAGQQQPLIHWYIPVETTLLVLINTLTICYTTMLCKHKVTLAKFKNYIYLLLNLINILKPGTYQLHLSTNCVCMCVVIVCVRWICGECSNQQQVTIAVPMYIYVNHGGACIFQLLCLLI